MAKEWRQHASVLVNGLLLTLLLVIFPLEREPFRTLRSRLRDYYPQINRNALAFWIRCASSFSLFGFYL